MNDQFERTRMLMGDNAIERLLQSHVAVFGVGGVGGYVVEVLARSGVGAIDLIDNDTVSVSNINRQIIALHSTVGRLKVDVFEERIHDINPDCKVKKYPVFFLPEKYNDTIEDKPLNKGSIDFSQYDYVVDCIDTVTGKIELARLCYEAKIPILSCMGAANKMDPTRFRVKDLFETNNDPLAKLMRKKLRKLGIDHLKVVCSDEIPMKPIPPITKNLPQSGEVGGGTSVPASNAFVPAAAGLVAGGEVIKDLIATT